jgi:ankyrin repeat protein
MHRAAEKGKTLRLRPFMSGDVNALDEHGNTALVLACSNGHLRCVEMLLNAKANIDATDLDDSTPLMIACREGHLPVANALIEARADLHKINLNSLSALHCACQRSGSHPIVEALLSIGMHVDSPQSPDSPLTVAVWCNSIQSMKVLIAAGASVDRVPGQSSSPLDAAALSGNVEAAQLLIDAKADVNAFTSRGSPLVFATVTGCLDPVASCSWSGCQ